MHSVIQAGPGTPSAFHASDAAIRSRLASRSLDLRRIFPAAAFADNAPPSTPGAARRGGKGSVSRCRRRPGRVRRGRAEAGQTWGREALAAHPAWSLVVRSSPSRAQRPGAPTTPQRPPRALALPRSLWLCQGLRTRGAGTSRLWRAVRCCWPRAGALGAHGRGIAGRALDIRRFRYDSKRRLHLGKLWGVKENPCFYVAMVAFPCADTTTFAMIQNGEEKHYPNKAART